MSRHRHHHSCRRPRVSRTLFLGIAGLFAAAAFVTFAVFSPASSSLNLSAHSILRQALDFGKRSLGQIAPGRQRLVYPYSIIAGGVHSAQELRQATQTDPVAAAQYASFDMAKTKVVTLQHDGYAYVSFRIGDDVYWTRHKIKLCKGETLITDGKHFGRTRCGNRMSKTARLPFFEHDPSAETLNTPVKPTVETDAFAAIAPPGSVFETYMSGESPIGPFLPAAHEMASALPTTFSAIGFPPVLPPPVCDPATTCTKNEKPSPPPPSPPPSPTPEMSEWALMGTGLTMLLVRALRRRARMKA